MRNNTQIQKRAIAYSFLAHISTTGTFADGPLDIFVPIVKNALSELYPDGSARGANLSEIVKAIEIYLSKEGYNILKAYNGQDALKLVKNNSIHLIILDIMRIW